MKCVDCAVWEMDKKDKNFGLCKCEAPSPAILKVIDNAEYQIVWPKTGKDDWCGRFKKKLELVS